MICVGTAMSQAVRCSLQNLRGIENRAAVVDSQRIRLKEGCWVGRSRPVGRDRIGQWSAPQSPANALGCPFSNRPYDPCIVPGSLRCSP